MKFTELLAGFGSSWPEELVNTSWPPTADITGLLAQIDDAMELHDAAADIGADGTLTLTATLKITTGSAPADTRLVSRLFPSMQFLFRPELDWSSDFRSSVARDGTVTVQIDTLPLDVLVPPDLLAAHPDEAQRGADTKIALSVSGDPTVITRDFRLILEATGALRLEPHLPISVGPCRLMGVPCRAVHDIVLIGAPARAHRIHDWVVRPLDGALFPFDCGGLGFGGIEFDFETADGNLAAIRRAAHVRDDAELVIEDLVIPAVFLPPLPQHGTLGLRRSLEPGESLEDHLSFQQAPIQFPLGNAATLFFDQLFFRTPPEEEALVSGLSLEAGIAVSFGEGGNDDWDFSIGLIDGDVLRLSIGRALPPAGTDALPILNIDVWFAVVDIVRARFGASLAALQAEEVEAGDALQVIGDVLIREKPDSESSPVQVETEDGGPFELALVDVGWDRGSVSGSILKQQGLTLTMGPFALEIHEAGFVAEDGATYITLSGGIRETTSPFTGRVFFERLRGRLAGNPDAPGFKLGGFGASLEIEDKVEIEVHGSFRNEVLPDGTRLKEHGLGGKLTIHASKAEWGLSLDVYWGERVPVVEPRIDYLLFQVALFGAIPVGPLELRGIEALYADQLQPKLSKDEPAVGQLKYYPWLKKARPTALPADRGLTAWKPELGAWAFGAGFTVGFTGCGEMVQASAFALGFESETENGLIIVLELKILGKDKPIAVGVLEYDSDRDAFILQILVDIRLQELIENFPDDLNVRLGGTITVGNRPGLVAFGRLDSQESWIGGNIEVALDSIARLKIRIALCFEWLESEFVGGGFIFSISVESRLGPMRFKGWGSLLVLLRFMLSGTNDYIARIAFEMGFAIVLFGFLRFGISMSLLADWLAHLPNFFVFRATFRLETPWFMPDFSVTVECTSGTLDPPARAMLTGALVDASARSAVGTRSMRVGRIDGLAGSAQPRLMALVGLPAEAAALAGEAMPVPLDATIEIQFAPMLADRVGIGQTDPDLGRQTTGDGAVSVEALYELVGVQVRRRPLGTAAWTVIEDFAGPADPRKGRWSWDLDTRTNGQTAPKKLLYNGSTPFTVAEASPLADTEILEENPAFPCCLHVAPDVARLDFCDEPLGARPAGFVRRLDFIRRGTPSPIRARVGPCAVRPPVQPGSACDRVAGFVSGRPISLGSEEELAEVTISFAAVARVMTVTFLARDRAGEVADRIVKSLSGNVPFATIAVHPERPFTSLDILVATTQNPEDDIKLHPTLEINWIECLLEADRAHAEEDQQRCDRVDADGHGEKSPFLPQQEYEIRLTTRIGIRHTTSAPETRTVVERAAFVTAGIPGLNETAEPGLELRRHVISRPAGGRGHVYRDESVHLVLSSDLRLFGPGAGGDDEAGFRYPVTLTVGTRLDSRPEAALERSSFESEEWFLHHRGSGGLIVKDVLHDLIIAARDRGLKGRYRNLSAGSPGTCPPDDTWLENRPRLGVAPFDAAGRPLWQARTGYRATMRPAGGPVVHRAPFEAADIGAFRAISGSWTVEDGLFKAAAPAAGRFGDPDWDSFQLLLTGGIEAGGLLSAAVLIDPANPGGGIRFTVVAHADGSGTLEAGPVTGGVSFGSRPIPALPATLSLRVETFADRVRAGVAGLTLSIDREARRPGLCEIGAAQGAIVSLTVRGLEMYGFDFDTSRYESFAEHVRSAGELARLPVTGAEETLAQLLARLGGEIDAAMQPAAPDSERERVFGEVVRSLAVPLREAPDRFHLELAAVEAGDRWLVLEGPEPLDLVEEVVLRLRRRVPLPPIDAGLAGRVRDLLTGLFDPSPFPVPPRRRGVPPRRRVAAPIGRDPATLGVRGRAALMDPRTPDFRPPRRRRPFVSVALAGRRLVVTILATGEVKTRPATSLSRSDLLALSGVTLFFDRAGTLVDWTRPDDSELEDVGMVAIQNATGTQALLFPRASLPAGDYRLDFQITRRWFDTTAAPGSDNAYQGQASREFVLP